MDTISKPAFLGMTVAAGLLVAPMMAFGQTAPAPATPPAASSTTRVPDGAPGNPPSTATGRALDRATGTPTNPDGVGNNPPGTAVGRAIERATPNVTSPAPDGTPGNPPGTAVGRAIDRATGATPGAADGTPGNPPGTAAGRALDRATEPSRDAAGSAVPGAVRPPAATTGTAATGPAAAGAMHAMGDNQRVSQIIGSRVYNDRNEAIGEVDDVILSGTSHSAVISVGGFLGLGARLVQVPLSDIRWNAERERMMLPGATKEQLQSRPAFDYNTLRRG